MTTVALIPSYQPDDRLSKLVAALRMRGIEGVVVDDGSGERYQPLFKAVSRIATVIGYEDNCGKGHALKSGLHYIKRHYADDTVVVTVDADGQHDVDDVMRCAQRASDSTNAMVLGCRSFDGSDVPLRSRVGNLVTRGIYRIASGEAVSDTQTGLRAFSARLIDFLLTVGGERYEYEMNVLLACPANHVALQEVPIRTIYEGGNAVSHFRPVQDSLRIYGNILAFVGSSLVSFLVDYLLFGVLATLLAAWGTSGVALANIGARLVSASFNFLVNRSLVFDSHESLYVTAMRYALLALGIMTGNTLAVLLLVDLLGVPAMAAKLIAELSFFVVSWFMQSRFVFGRRTQ